MANEKDSQKAADNSAEEKKVDIKKEIISWVLYLLFVVVLVYVINYVCRTTYGCRW